MRQSYRHMPDYGNGLQAERDEFKTLAGARRAARRWLSLPKHPVRVLIVDQDREPVEWVEQEPLTVTLEELDAFFA